MGSASMLAVVLLNRISTKPILSGKRDNPKMVMSETLTPKVVCCRTCLRTEDLVSIFDNQGSEQDRSHDLKLVTGLEISMDDGLPQKICSQCIEKVNQAIQFRRTSRQAEETLRNKLTAKPMGGRTSPLQEPIINKGEKVELKLLEEDYSHEIFKEQNYEVAVKEERKKTPAPTRSTKKTIKKRTNVPKPKSFKCTTCSKEFKKKTSLRSHENHHTFYRICETCGKRCRNDTQLQNHKRLWHGLIANYKCDFCEYSSVSKEALMVHERLHTGEMPYQCDHCDAAYSGRQNLVKHLAIHMPMKNFQRPTATRKKEITTRDAISYECTTCGKEFKKKSLYETHLQSLTHSIVCETCGKRCRNNNQLQEHQRARHGLNRIHKCAYCDYSSATKEALTIHERRHTGERPYECDHCGATFHRRSNLVQHIAIHLSEKNFQCDTCPLRFKSRKFLQIHKHNAHTGKRYRYMCGICEDRFEKPNKVRAHARRVHGLDDDQQGPIHRVQL